MRVLFYSNVILFKDTTNIYDKNIDYDLWKPKDPWRKPTFVISTDFSFSLCCKILNTSFHLESLMMTFFGLTFHFKRLHASTFAGSTEVSHLLKIFKTQYSKPSSWTDSGIAEISRLSRRGYCSFVQHFLSTKKSYRPKFWKFCKSQRKTPVSEFLF